MMTLGFFSVERAAGVAIGLGAGGPDLSGIWLPVKVLFECTGFFTFTAGGGGGAGAAFLGAGTAFATGLAGAFATGFATGLAAGFATGLATTAFLAAGAAFF